MKNKEFLVPRTIYIPSRRIVKEGNGRFKIYLPTNMRKLWKILHGKRVDIYIVIGDDDEDNE